MQDEIFGPILPIIAYEDINEVIEYVRTQPKPLALYLFSTNNELQQKIINRTSSGGICINNTRQQFINLNAPFGGVGMSGFGRYHRKASFLTFSNAKSIVKSSRFELPYFLTGFLVGKKSG
jgi:aldehyde dehydrogenase (NAD+)